MPDVRPAASLLDNLWRTTLQRTHRDTITCTTPTGSTQDPGKLCLRQWEGYSRFWKLAVSSSGLLANRSRTPRTYANRSLMLRKLSGVPQDSLATLAKDNQIHFVARPTFVLLAAVWVQRFYPARTITVIHGRSGFLPGCSIPFFKIANT